MQARTYGGDANMKATLDGASEHRGRDTRPLGPKLHQARAACAAAIGLYDEVALLFDWLRHACL